MSSSVTKRQPPLIYAGLSRLSPQPSIIVLGLHTMSPAGGSPLHHRMVGGRIVVLVTPPASIPFLERPSLESLLICAGLSPAALFSS